MEDGALQAGEGAGGGTVGWEPLFVFRPGDGGGGDDDDVRVFAAGEREEVFVVGRAAGDDEVALGGAVGGEGCLGECGRCEGDGEGEKCGSHSVVLRPRCD